jgi:hypothetical protein
MAKETKVTLEAENLDVVADRDGDLHVVAQTQSLGRS